jgi:hypothetical protein
VKLAVRLNGGAGFTPDCRKKADYAKENVLTSNAGYFGARHTENYSHFRKFLKLNVAWSLLRSGDDAHAMRGAVILAN